jgi:hypothetical protein
MAVDLSESSWKAFVKKQKLAVELDDKELLKALSRFDKSDERKPEPRLDALKELAKEIPRQVTALLKLKKQLGDKPFGLVKDELYAILEETEALQKKAQAAVDAEDEGDEEDDEDSAPNALVNPKLLLKQLTMCRKDPERTMKFAFVDAKGKDQPAMLAMHPRLSARKLFGKLQAAAGVKTGAYGSAWVDGTSLMLQLDKPLSGLVKKVRGPAKACGFRFTKAVLWDADGTVFEQDEQADGGAAPAGTASATLAGGSREEAVFLTRLKALLALVEAAGQVPQARDAKLLASEAGVASRKKNWARVDELMAQAEAQLRALTPDASPAQALDGMADAAAADGAATAASDPHAQFKQKLALWTPAIKAAMAARGPEAAAIAKLLAQSIASSKPGGDIVQALARLTDCQALAAAASPGGVQAAAQQDAQGAQADGSAPSDADARFQAMLRTVTASWREASDTVDGQIAALQAALLKSDDPELRQIGELGLNAVTGNFKVPLLARLRDLADAPAAQRASAVAAARAAVSGFRRHLTGSAQVAVVDNNPTGVTVRIVATLVPALDALEKSLEAVA